MGVGKKEEILNKEPPYGLSKEGRAKDNTNLEVDSIVGVDVMVSCRMGEPNHLSNTLWG